MNPQLKTPCYKKSRRDSLFDRKLPRQR